MWLCPLMLKMIEKVENERRSSQHAKLFRFASKLIAHEFAHILGMYFVCKPLGYEVAYNVVACDTHKFCTSATASAAVDEPLLNLFRFPDGTPRVSS